MKQRMRRVSEREFREYANAGSGECIATKIDELLTEWWDLEQGITIGVQIGNVFYLVNAD